MKYNLFIGIIAISFSLTLFSQENKQVNELILIGGLLWDIKNNWSGLDWEAAKKYCAEKEMRLPTKDELVANQDELIKIDESREAIEKNNRNKTHFYLYWSSTEYEPGTTGAWTVAIRENPNVPGPRSGPARKSSRFVNVRCVKNIDQK